MDISVLKMISLMRYKNVEGIFSEKRRSRKMLKRVSLHSNAFLQRTGERFWQKLWSYMCLLTIRFHSGLPRSRRVVRRGWLLFVGWWSTAEDLLDLLVRSLPRWCMLWYLLDQGQSPENIIVLNHHGTWKNVITCLTCYLNVLWRVS